jgi:hypothetical protein
VLQSVAWKIADQIGWPDTFDAEYVALTQLQADALITLDGVTSYGFGPRSVVSLQRGMHALLSRRKRPRMNSRRTVEIAESRSTMWCE